MTEILFKPLKEMPPTWKPADAKRPPSPFDSTYTQTLDLLDRELTCLVAREAFIQVDVPSNGVRIDGQLRANAVAYHPGVILTVQTLRNGTLIYQCDRFTRSWKSGSIAWQQNLRAIALGLEALRKVERYGIADSGQQYAGFAELGSGIPMGAGTPELTEEEALRILRDACGGISGLSVPEMYRKAARVMHPDAGGDAEAFRLVTAARDKLLNR